ncbi:MAG: selenocysteine-specific translation elongation factor [Herpetosiphonaceae bacterium]|nr:selenocysteine-specific translation elongation factor [Herpetosiphonaceae bacterium]
MQMNYVIGTAGHVDHGKSTLVQALTGMQADRLSEEQRREMTIDLGFTWLTLPSERVVSLVDVPGHERFIKNMLAGVGGIDAALLVIAADEGIMPQTQEHLHILDLLEIEHGLVVLTKCDLVDDEWLMLIEEEVRNGLQGTLLADAPIIPVSARTGLGLDRIQQALDDLLASLPSRTVARGLPRLPVDRVFTIGGFGTVVTGTLLDGPLNVGQEVELVPSGQRGRIRGLQSRHSKTEQALPGTRTAVNLTGVSVEAVRRGEVLTMPGAIVPTTLLDLKLRLVGDAAPLEHNTTVDVFIGSAEVGCSVALLDREVLDPDTSGWVQLRLQAPIAAVRGDRCIIRLPSPSRTIGGGRIVDVYPLRHRRFRPEVIHGLETLAKGTPAEQLSQVLATGGAQPWSMVAKASGLVPATAETALRELVTAGEAIILGEEELITSGTLVIGAGEWSKLGNAMVATLQSYHTSYPLRVGMARESLRQKLGLANARIFNLVIARAAHAGVIVLTETLAHLPNFAPQLTPAQQRQVTLMLQGFARTPYSPPARNEWEVLGPELIAFLTDTNQLVRVSPDVLFGSEAYTKLVEWVQRTLVEQGEITVGQLRDAFDTSRKYALALLEHLDERKITRRVGEGRTRY